MFNRPSNLLNDASPTRDARGAWQVDQNPTLRLVCLLALMLLPLAAVTARLVYLQVCLGEEFVTDVDDTVVTFEPIPSRDGRILASDGKVLAHDVERFNVLMHYRWLEEPADERWLNQQALSRLPRADRRDEDKLAAERERVLAERAAMWQRLAELTGKPPEQFSQGRSAVQQRVERIVATVEQNRAGQRESRDADSSRFDENSTTTAEWWQTFWKLAVAALTTPPERGIVDPIVIQEELDYHTVVEDVALPVAAQIETHPEQFPGLRIAVNTRRTYPAGALAPHVVGYRSSVDDDEIDLRRLRFPDGDPLDYRPHDRIGKTGVERSYDRELRGLRGERKVVRNRRGEIVRTEVVREPRVGRDMLLTLDIPLQQEVERILDETLGDMLPSTGFKGPSPSGSGVGVRENFLTETSTPASFQRAAQHVDSAEEEPAGPTPRGGCIIAVDVHTGAVIAAASAPRFDLSLFAGNVERDEWETVTGDPRRPFFPRATRMTLPPGSVFKTLTAVALLESGQVDGSDTIFCRGYLDTPDKHRCYIYRHFGAGHGEMDLSTAICQSCNVYFFATAREVGPGPLVDWAGRFGFGQPTGIDLPGELGGNLPAPPIVANSPASAVPHSAFPAPRSPWSSSDTLGVAIGQSRLTVTPLQIVRMMAAVANGGYLVTPHVVEQIIDAGGIAASASDSRGESFEPASGRFEPRRIPGLGPRTIDYVRKGLKDVVADPRGTGYKHVRMKDIEIAGKTGTAEVGGGLPDHAWFAGYVPADEPRIAFVVVLENAGSGGRTAGPVARRLVEAMLRQGLLRPTRVTMVE